jgi:hypothetical protein
MTLAKSVTYRRLRETLLLYAPLLAGILVMLPRLASPQFGMLDDGIILLMAEKARDNWLVAFRFSPELERFFLENQGGRFLPLFWLYHTLVYRLIGPDPWRAFLGQTLLLMALTAGLIGLVRARGGSKLQAGVAGLFFVLSGPIIENFYTMGKTEPIQLAWLGVSLIALLPFGRVRAGWAKAGLLLLSSGAVLLAMLIKETTVVLIPISLAWLGLGWLKQPGRAGRPRPARWAYVVAASLPVGLFFWLRAFFVPVSLGQGSNTSAYRLAWSTILITASQEVGWLLRDFIFLGPLLGFMLLLALLKKQRQGLFILETLVWLGGWLAIYLPWQLALEYYLLPVAAGAAVLGGIGVGQCLAYLRPVDRPAGLRRLAGLCLLLALAPWPLLLANNYSNGRLQLALDAANADFLDFVATLPPDSRVLLNLPRINEYVIKTEPLLAITRHRADLTIDYFEFQTPSPAQPQLIYYVAAPYLTNQSLPAVRVALTEWGARLWNEALLDFLQPQPDLVFTTGRSFRLLDFGLQQLSCPFFRWAGLEGLFCFLDQPVLDRRVLTYGWQLYRVTGQIRQTALPALFLPEGVWRLHQGNGLIREIKFGQAGDIPLTADWTGSGFSGLILFRPDNLTWYLDQDYDGQAEVDFQFAGMGPADLPLFGDWDGDGRATPAYFRPGDRSWHFSNRVAAGQVGEDFPPLTLGAATVVPLAGDWDGDGHDTIGYYRPESGQVSLWNSPDRQQSFSLVESGRPVVADWAGRGRDSLAVVREGQWHNALLNCACTPSNPPPPLTIALPPGSIPLAGHWPAPGY